MRKVPPIRTVQRKKGWPTWATHTYVWIQPPRRPKRLRAFLDYDPSKVLPRSAKQVYRIVEPK